MSKRYLASLLFLLMTSLGSAQIVPPGLGDMGSSGWMAIAIDQNINRYEETGWKSTTYFGVGRVSGKEHDQPLKKPGIFVLNQEFYNRFKPNWEYSLALSLRNQRLYTSKAPFEPADPPSKKEIRLYSRFSYLHKIGSVSITPTLRQEIIKYFTPDFEDFSESWRIRTRFRLKFGVPLKADNSHKILLYSEQLFSFSRHLETERWSRFSYADSRFSSYYSVSPAQLPFTFNVGYMLNLMGKGPAKTGHYLALDVIWKNPFR